MIYILHFTTSHLHDLVTSFQSCLRSWRVVAHAVQLQTIIRIRVIRNRAEIDAKTHRASLRFALRYGVSRPFVEPIKAANNLRDERDHARFAHIVDFVRRIRRLVIVLMIAGPEKEHWNLLGVEGGVIAGTVAVFVEG